eukprot:1193845-Prorocentrum_minimum.AAC.2
MGGRVFCTYALPKLLADARARQRVQARLMAASFPREAVGAVLKSLASPVGPHAAIKPLLSRVCHWRIQFSPQIFAAPSGGPWPRRYGVQQGTTNKNIQARISNFF